MYVCMCVCLCVCLSVSVCLCLSLCVCLYTSTIPHEWICLFVCALVNRSVCLSVSLSVCQNVCLSVCLPACLSLCPSVQCTPCESSYLIRAPFSYCTPLSIHIWYDRDPPPSPLPHQAPTTTHHCYRSLCRSDGLRSSLISCFHCGVGIRKPQGSNRLRCVRLLIPLCR